jgi:hypothetical protein
MSGDQMDLKRYMVIATPKGSERDTLGAGDFARLAADSLRNLGSIPAGTDYPRYLDTQPQGRAALLAHLVKEQTVVSVLQGSRLPTKSRSEPPTYILSTTTLMLVRGKALNLAVYSAYETEDDAEWARAVTARWIEDLKRLNSR